MRQSELKKIISVESYDEKTDEIATLRKSTLFPNYQRYQIQVLIAQIEDWNVDCVSILHSFREIRGQRALRSVVHPFYYLQ